MNKQFKINLVISILFMALIIISMSFFNHYVNTKIAYDGIVCLNYYYSSYFIFIVAALTVFIINNKKYIKESNSKLKDILKNIVLPVVIIVILFLLLISAYFLKVKLNSKKGAGIDFKLDTPNKYLVQYYSCVNLRNELSRYYKIDLDKKNIVELTDNYLDFMGNKKMGTIIDSREISNEDVIRLKELLDMVFLNIDTNLLDIQEKHVQNNISKIEQFIDYPLIYNNYYVLFNRDYLGIKVYNREITKEIFEIIK